jgi:protein gp37
MEKTKIEWTDSTVNFWTGCKKVSEGCSRCYMYRNKERYGQDPTTVLRTKDKTFSQALKWKDPRRIFTCSWSDFFIENADRWRNDAWDIIKKTPQHDWQILTKRPERIMQCLPNDWGDGWDNVWLGTSIESQKYLQRAAILGEVPAIIRFISAEPLLGQIDLKQLGSDLDKYHWCIVGGESGNNNGKYRYRECELEWIEKIINDLQGTSVSVFIKQMGTHLAKQMGLKDRHGGDLDEWPMNLRIREFPDLQVLKSAAEAV